MRANETRAALPLTVFFLMFLRAVTHAISLRQAGDNVAAVRNRRRTSIHIVIKTHASAGRGAGKLDGLRASPIAARTSTNQQADGTAAGEVNGFSCYPLWDNLRRKDKDRVLAGARGRPAVVSVG